MTQISTPTHHGPSAQTLDFLRNYARHYTAQPPVVRHIIVQTNPVCPQWTWATT